MPRGSDTDLAGHISAAQMQRASLA